MCVIQPKEVSLDMDFENYDTGYFYDIIIETRILLSVISKISSNTILSQYV